MELEQARELIEATRLKLEETHPFLETWKLVLDKAKRRAGVCRLIEKEIGISLWHIENNCMATVLDTLLHEFAHAIAFELYNHTGHGEGWKKIARELGATPKATGKFNLPEPPWILVNYCEVGNVVERISPRFRRNKNIRKYAIKGRPNTKGKLYYLNADTITCSHIIQ